MRTLSCIADAKKSRRHKVEFHGRREAPLLLRVTGDIEKFPGQSSYAGPHAGPGALLRDNERLRAKVRRLEARVSQLNGLAHLDPLVDLPNRRSFVASLERLIARVRRYGDPGAMLFVDLNGLKAINDTFGHKVGDEALISVAKLLVASVRKSDLVGRLGGDEFAILLGHADQTTALQMALRVGETVERSRFCVDGTHLPLSVAVGLGGIQAEDDAQSVIMRADNEMYRVKRESHASAATSEPTAFFFGSGPRERT